MNGQGNTWPEQNVVDAFFEKYKGRTLGSMTHPELMELKCGVTEMRVKAESDLAAANERAQRFETALQEREESMHARIRADYDKAIERSWTDENARLRAEVATLREDLNRGATYIYSGSDTENMLRAEVERLTRDVSTMCEDWAHDHTEMQNKVRQFVPGADVEGDSYCAPGILDLADILTMHITVLTRERDEAIAEQRGSEQDMKAIEAQRDEAVALLREVLYQTRFACGPVDLVPRIMAFLARIGRA